MLMAAILSLMSTMMIKSSKLWQVMTKMTMYAIVLLLAQYPMKNSTFLLSNNWMLDTLSMSMIILSMWISCLMISCSYKTKKNQKLFLTMITALLITLMLLFSTNNTIMFYILFELSVIPVLLLIMFWGYQPERITASFYISLYMVSASLPLLMILIMMMKMNYHSNLMFTYMMTPENIDKNMSSLMLIMAFLVKLPLFSLHLWLPKAHVEAPLAGSMVLAAILLKLGSYGLLRMNKIIHNKTPMIFNMVMSIAMIGSIITNIMCVRQTDLKSLIAYSSVSHMGLMIIGLMSNSKLGQYSSLMIMLTHGLTSSCLFMLTNTMYEKTSSRNIMLMKSNLLSAPMISTMWIITMATNMALPPSLNTLGEVTIMMSSLMVSKMIMILLMITGFTTAMYSLYMYSMINHGNKLKITLPMLQAPSVDMMNWFSHIWPLIMFLATPMMMMTWC